MHTARCFGLRIPSTTPDGRLIFTINDSEDAMLVGYARTSTWEQVAGLEAQQRDLLATGCKRFFTEHESSVAARPQLQAVLEYVREGDVLVVTKMDRLARSTADLLRIVAELERKQVGLRICDFGGQSIDTQSPSGKLLLTMFAAIGQWEREAMLVRQREGIAKAKAEGRYKGRAPTARRKLPEIKALRAEGLRPSAIAERLMLSRASVYRLLSEIEA
jgi:DNA invertase Pin-like site-specific DNA recombinase